MWVDGGVDTVAVGASDLMGKPCFCGGVAHSIRCGLLRDAYICALRVIGIAV